MDEDETQLSDEDWQAFLNSNPSTLPEFAYTFRGFDDEATRNALVAAMSPLASFMSRLHPMHGLAGITVATDYREALAGIDRGIETSDVPEPTAESFGTGVAMSLGVVRDGRLRTVVVFEASIILALLSEDPELRALSTHTFMHEMGHVAEHSLDDARFGEAMVRPFTDRYEFQLYRLSHDCWGEYYASRLSAPWGADAMPGLLELLRGSLEQLRERVGTARQSTGSFMGERNNEAARAIIGEVSQLMKYAGYVIGHARGADVAPIEAGSQEEALLVDLGLSDWFAELGGHLDAIYDGRGEWADLTAFHPLHRSFEAACLVFKLQLHRSEEYDIAWRIWF